MNAPQGSEAWLLARAGHCTASRFADVLAKIKTGGEASSRRNYRIQLVTERLTCQPVEGYKNSAMEWGNEKEPEARDAYEARTGVLVEQTDFLTHPAVEWCGASPDGLVGDEGAIEIKCPYVSTVHVETLMAGGAPSDHIPQIQGVLWVTGRQWCDFVSFDPRMPEHLQLHVHRVARDEAYIATLAEEVQRFLAEVDELAAKLLKRA
jgi:putative phage-type endonuclease